MFGGDSRQNSMEDFAVLIAPFKHRLDAATKALQEHMAGRESFIAGIEADLNGQTSLFQKPNNKRVAPKTGKAQDHSGEGRTERP